MGACSHVAALTTEGRNEWTSAREASGGRGPLRGSGRTAQSLDQLDDRFPPDQVLWAQHPRGLALGAPLQGLF